MKALLDFLETLRDKYKEKYLYGENWEDTSIDDVVSRDDKYEIAKMVIVEKIKLRYMVIILNWTYSRPYIKTVKIYKELMKPINVMVAVALDILESMIYAEAGNEYDQFIEEYRESHILKDEYVMSDEEYKKYSMEQSTLY